MQKTDTAPVLIQFPTAQAPALFENVGLLAQRRLTTDCGRYAHCAGADLTRDGRVDLEDFAILAAQWVQNP